MIEISIIGLLVIKYFCTGETHLARTWIKTNCFINLIRLHGTIASYGITVQRCYINIQ